VEIISGPSTGQKLTRKPHDVRIFLDALNALREDQAVMKCVSKTLKGAWDKYDDLLEEHRYLDYSVILVEAVEALLDSQDPERIQVQQEIGDRVKYLIVDEYQDVNPVQETRIRRLHELGANICVVGDDDQSIYQLSRKCKLVRNVRHMGKKCWRNSLKNCSDGTGKGFPSPICAISDCSTRLTPSGSLKSVT
jgi:superfamily I DNA/RNA helicase